MYTNSLILHAGVYTHLCPPSMLEERILYNQATVRESGDARWEGPHRDTPPARFYLKNIKQSDTHCKTEAFSSNHTQNLTLY